MDKRYGLSLALFFLTAMVMSGTAPGAENKKVKRFSTQVKRLMLVVERYRNENIDRKELSPFDL